MSPPVSEDQAKRFSAIVAHYGYTAFEDHGNNFHVMPNWNSAESLQMIYVLEGLIVEEQDRMESYAVNIRLRLDIAGHIRQYHVLHASAPVRVLAMLDTFQDIVT